MKCKGKDIGNGKIEQHDLMAKANFCGECGSPPAPAETMLKCAACDTELMAKSSFCHACGVEATTTTDQLDKVAEEITTFAKARATELGALTVPVIEDVEIDPSTIDALMAKASVYDAATGEEGLDSTPIVAEMLKAQTGTNQFLGQLTKHLTDRIGGLERENGMLLKAVPALIGMLKSVSERVDGLGKSGVGRRGQVVPVRELPKHDDAPDAGPHGDLAGDDLMAKCLLATEKDGSLLSSNESSALEAYCAAGYSLKSIVHEDPALGARAMRAVATVTTH